MKDFIGQQELTMNNKIRQLILLASWYQLV